MIGPSTIYGLLKMSSILEVYARFIIRLVKSRRFFILFGAISGISGFLMLLSEPFAYGVQRVFLIDPVRTGLLLSLISLAAIALVYLQSGGRRADMSEDLFNSLRATLLTFSARVAKLEKTVSITAERVDELEPSIDISAEERKSALEEIVQRSGNEAISSIFQEKARLLRDELKEGLVKDRLVEAFSAVVQRLRREIADLRLRSNVNLLIGMVITAGGLYLLWATVEMIGASSLLKALASEGGESNAKFFKNLVLPMAPRVLLVVFLEVFAYFFLRLYKSGLDDIKYYQNELTNVELKLVALESAFMYQHKESLGVALESLARTERNFILEKGQTTVELEKAKAESELLKRVVGAIPEILKSKLK